jgi:hypothetical protein
MSLVVLGLVMFLCSSTAVLAETHVVGDSKGWGFSVSYDSWATGKAFAAGDTLGRDSLSPPSPISKKAKPSMPRLSFKMLYNISTKKVVQIYMKPTKNMACASFLSQNHSEK